MKKKLLFILILIPVLISAQSGFNISGKVKGVDGEPLEFVNIILDKNNKYGVSDANGNYLLQNVPQGSYILTFSTIGFKSIIKKITVNNNVNLNITLKEETEALDDVEIIAKKESTKQKEKAITIGSFEIKDVIATTNVLTEQVNQMSGVRVRNSGGLGSDTDISVNGLTGTSVRQYIDGIPLEFLYPGLNISNIPIGNTKRVDIYKGVIPVDIGTDALGGAINIITENKTKNHLRASYSIGSFNTHIADVNLTLANDKNNYVNVNGGIAYSDNDYTFDAKFLVPIDEFNNKIETREAKRFHDAYKLEYMSGAIGTSKKKWEDNAKLSLNYLKGSQEVQNGVTIQTTAIGEALNTAENISAILAYDKTILEDKLKFKTVFNYGLENLVSIDTTRNKYDWDGNATLGTERTAGEIGERQYSKNKTSGAINRSSLYYDINETNRLLLSNIIAKRNRIVSLFDFDNNVFREQPDQEMIKNILGLQYEGDFFEDKLKVTGAVKSYFYEVTLIDPQNDDLFNRGENFYGWNVSFKYTVFPEFDIRGSYEKGFLIPELTQIVGNPPITESNILLKPEKSHNFNLGILYNHTFNKNYRLNLIANAFLREIQDNIYNPPGAGVTSAFENAEDIDSKGVEGEVELKFLKNFNWKTSVSYVDKTFADFADELSKPLIGSSFPNTPSFFYNTRFSWSKKNIFKTKVDFSIYGSFNHIDTFNYTRISTTETVESNPDAFIPESNQVNTGITLHFLDRQIATSFNIRNLTDQKMFDNYSIPLPGRSFNLKLIYEISKF